MNNLKQNIIKFFFKSDICSYKRIRLNSKRTAVVFLKDFE